MYNYTCIIQARIFVMSGEPGQISVCVIVYSARDLQGYKKGDVCQASVVFGHGKDYYTTEVVESSTPEWNQEASIHISSHFQEPVRFKVKDREHTLGSVTMPLSELSNSPNRLWLPLLPHKRASEVHGSLQVGCWVTSYHQCERVPPATHEEVRVWSGRGPFGRTPSSSRSNTHRHSMHEKLPGEARGQDGLQNFPSDNNFQGAEMKEEEARRGNADHSPAADESGLPEVTGVSPNEGPVGGGQRVVLRGSCLGESRADVMQVLVAGVDCTSQLEYFSPSKLAVMTAPRTAPGSGPVVVQTHSGGVGVSWINFTFVEASECMADSPHQGRRNKNGDTAETALKTELKVYKQQVKELKDNNKRLCEENDQLRGYIDRLLLEVLAHSPGVLEVRSTSSDPSQSNLTQ